MLTARRAAVVGAGWAGLAAAVRAVQLGWTVTVFDTAGTPGGRARSENSRGEWLDNGQHILIGAYTESLALMREVGVPLDQAFARSPLSLVHPDGSGLRLPQGHPVLSFARGVLAHGGWPVSARLSLLARAARWSLARFRCAPGITVARLAEGLPSQVLDELVAPLCVAALNTPMEKASGEVFLRVLHDALFSGPGCADLMLPRWPLQKLLPEPAADWLARHGAELRWRHRVTSLEREASAAGNRWRIDGEAFDAVVLACTSAEAARLAAPHAPAWSAVAAGFRHEPIVTVVLDCEGLQLAHPMLALREGPRAPAQFVFDHGQLGGPPGRLAFVVSGAAHWVQQGLDACLEATLEQAQACLPGFRRETAGVVACRADKRATFQCVPGLQRPSWRIAPGLLAAGDYVEGPYPSTLEGAVRAGLRAAGALG